MPNPEDAFNDKNAPKIPDFVQDDRDERDKKRRDESWEREQRRQFDNTERESEKKKQYTQDANMERQDLAESYGISDNLGSAPVSGGGDMQSAEMLNEMRAIRNAIEALLNS